MRAKRRCRTSLDNALPGNVLCNAKDIRGKQPVMKDLNDALSEIAAIRSQIVRTAEFRGYGPITVAMTGLVAIAAAELQARLLPAAAHEVATYLTLWISTAAIAISLIG